MGTDKAFVQVDGVAMVARVADALAEGGASDVVCVGGDAVRLGRLGLACIADGWPGEGPLGGLLTALDWSGSASVVIAGCDQPWLDAGAIRTLVDAHRGGRAPVTVYRVGDRVQPLPGVYDVSLRLDLRAAMDRGERVLGLAFGLVAPTVLDAPVPEALRDVDAPHDLPAP